MILKFLVFILLIPWHSFAQSIDLSELPADIKKQVISKFKFLQDNDPEEEKKKDSKSKESKSISNSKINLPFLDELIQYLITEMQFSRVSAEETSPQKYKIYYQLTKKIQKIEISGNRSTSSSELRNEFAISEKTIFDKNAIIEGAEKIRQYYNEKGFPDAKVELSLSEPNKAFVEIGIRIIEGPQQKIKTVEFICPNLALVQLLKRKSKSYSNEPLTAKVMQQLKKDLMKALSENNYFRTDLLEPELVQASDKKSYSLIYRLPFYDKYKLEFDGNISISARALESAMDIENYHTANPQIAAELGSRIKNHYLSQGYARAEIKESETVNEKAFLRTIKFSVQEGPRIKIKSIEFFSRNQDSHQSYRDFIFTNGGEVLAEGYYVREELDHGLNALIVDLQNRGYLKSKIISSRSTFDKDKKTMTVFINLDEGPVTYLQKLAFEGNKSFSQDTLKNLLPIKEKEPLQLNLLEEALDKVKSHYQEQGFIEMTILNEKADLVKYNEDNTKAEVIIRINEGPKVIVGSIILEGNTFTKDYVLMKELEFSNGEILTPSKIDESLKRLQRLGIFGSVDIKMLEERSSISVRTIIVRVSERDPGLFNFGLGVNNERQLTLRGYTGVAYRNIGGTARAASLRFDGNYNVAEVKYLENKITVGYLEPYILNSRVRGRLNLTRSKTINDQITDNSRGIETNQTSWAFEQDITSHITATYELLSIATIKDFAINGEDCITCTTINIASTGPTLDIDYRDHPFNPTKGTFTRMSLEYASPSLGSSRTIQYLRGFASFSHYWSPWKPGWTWANSFRYGYLENLSKETDGGVPYDKKGLVMGGQSTIRGFEGKEAFPNEQFDFGPGYLLTTQADSYLIKSEIRFPVYKNFGGAVFYDGGAVVIKDLYIEDSYRDAVGIAARYNTPVGAVSFEFGYKLDTIAKRNENQWALHIYIGTF